jgi:hypothetical protein
MESVDDLNEALAAFTAPSPQLLEARSLQKRFDRKYLLRKEELGGLLVGLSDEYRLVGADVSPVGHYLTRYFDTPELVMHYDHGRGRRPRFKVRLRTHRTRELTFLEVKRKGADNRTTKFREDRPFMTDTLDNDAFAFIAHHAPVEPAQLRAMVDTAFQRVTLVGVSTEERVTVDFDLSAATPDADAAFGQLAIVEVKQAHLKHGTAVVRALRHRGRREHSLSKYCLGVCDLVEGARTQPFADELRGVRGLAS